MFFGFVGLDRFQIGFHLRQSFTLDGVESHGRLDILSVRDGYCPVRGNAGFQIFLIPVKCGDRSAGGELDF